MQDIAALSSRQPYQWFLRHSFFDRIPVRSTQTAPRPHARHSSSPADVDQCARLIDLLETSEQLGTVPQAPAESEAEAQTAPEGETKPDDDAPDAEADSPMIVWRPGEEPQKL